MVGVAIAVLAEGPNPRLRNHRVVPFPCQLLRGRLDSAAQAFNIRREGALRGTLVHAANDDFHMLERNAAGRRGMTIRYEI